MKRLSGWDAVLLYSETPNVHMHTLKVAVIELDPAPLGVVNPAGVAMSRFAAPAPTGWKLTVVVLVSGLMVTGLFTMVPMVVSDVVTVTLTLKPVRRFWLFWAVSVAGFN